MSRRKKEEEPENEERWLLTYSDMITLLMVFFIVLYAISSVNSQKYEKLKESLGEALNPAGYAAGAVIVVPPDTETEGEGISPEDMEALNAQALAQKLQSLMNENGMQDNVSVNVTERGVVVSLKDSILFESGKYDVKAQSVSGLNAIGKTLASVNNFIRIEGNTDNVPMNKGIIKSNWELSALRATQVLETLVRSGISPDRISTVGYGEFRPVAPNNSPENRALNRRVDIVVLNDTYKNSESDAKGTAVPGQ